MRKTIVRTITASTINSANVKFVDGKPEVTDNVPLVVSGTIPEEKALKAVRKAYGEAAQVTKIVEVNEVREISVEDFIKHSKVVKNPTTEQQTEGATE